MKYVSTRGASPVLGFADVLLTGLAPDGGLYVPESAPAWDAPHGEATYQVVAAQLMWPFVEGSMSFDELADAVDSAYATFDDAAVCPVVDLGDGMYVQELWHGPTLAFKDVALQLVGRLFDAELTRRGERATIVVATSGDTGSAAIAACVGRANLDIVVLHPAGRVSEVQRRQMTTVDEPNVRNVAIDGSFDDCQDLLKAMFADETFRREVSLSAMNSINWARVMAQIVYYRTGVTAVAPDGGPVVFSVPSGNFGNVLAGWYARSMGVPIERLVVGSNRNDILARWVETGALVAEPVVPTISPAMDIQVSSNLERLLFDLLGRDGSRTADVMTRFRGLGAVEVPQDPLFTAARLDDDQTRDVIRDTHTRHGYLIDPHTAVGVGAAQQARTTGRIDPELPVVCLSTARPAKFPDAVEAATGIRPPLPDALADLLDRPERYELLPNDLSAVETFVRNAIA
ncbi:MAG: threonine synthase [Actinomycetota bacterium]|nr:threonine synthase [Actinomycetota bacterium]